MALPLMVALPLSLTLPLLLPLHATIAPWVLRLAG